MHKTITRALKSNRKQIYEKQTQNYTGWLTEK